MAYSGNYYRPSMMGGFSFFPPVIKMLLIINGAVFLLTEFVGRAFTIGGEPVGNYLMYYFALWPIGNGFLPWQVISYQFMHAGFWHLLFNMFFGLWMFGPELEHIWGPRRFLIFYLTCGVVAAVFQLILGPILEPGRTSVVVGASGSIFGVLVAFAMMFPDRYIYLWFLIPVKVKYFVMFIIAMGVFAIGGTSQVANLAHLGGAFAGFVYMLALRRHSPVGGAFQKVQHWAKEMTRTRPVEGENDAVERRVFNINEGKKTGPQSEQESLEKRMNEILDKVSQSGYQSLTEEEKKILFDASKRIH